MRVVRGKPCACTRPPPPARLPPLPLWCPATGTGSASLTPTPSPSSTPSATGTASATCSPTPYPSGARLACLPSEAPTGCRLAWARVHPSAWPCPPPTICVRAPAVGREGEQAGLPGVAPLLRSTSAALAPPPPRPSTRSSRSHGHHQRLAHIDPDNLRQRLRHQHEQSHRNAHPDPPQYAGLQPMAHPRRDVRACERALGPSLGPSASAPEHSFGPRGCKHAGGRSVGLAWGSPPSPPPLTPLCPRPHALVAPTAGTGTPTGSSMATPTDTPVRVPSASTTPSCTPSPTGSATGVPPGSGCPGSARSGGQSTIAGLPRQGSRAPAWLLSFPLHSASGGHCGRRRASPQGRGWG